MDETVGPSEVLKELATELAMSTARGDVPWEQAGQAKFEAVYFSGRIRVASVDGDGYAPHLIEVLNREGTVVDEGRTIFPIVMGLGGEHPQGASDWNALLADLYQAAKRASVQADKTMSEFLKDVREGRGPDHIPF